MTAPISSLFADYRPRPDRCALDATLAGASKDTASSGCALVRKATPSDLEALARISAEREGVAIETSRDALVRVWFVGDASSRRQLEVAEIDGQVVAFGKVMHFTPAVDAPPDIAPAGWYLSGLVVSPDHRRRGIGLALTRSRLVWIAERASEAYFFASAVNRPTIDLHVRCGFVEVTRRFSYPGVTFTGGVGILFRKGLTSVTPP